MIRLEDFSKAVEFIQKKAKEKNIEIVQVSSSIEEINFLGKTKGHVTRVYAYLNMEHPAVYLIPPLVDKGTYFRVCDDGTFVQISPLEYEMGDRYYDYYDED